MANVSRIEWIDLTKGIAIFLMVIGHTSIPSTVSNWIWSFHMPLFFIVSGMLYQPHKADNFREFTLHKFRTMGVPYVFFLGCELLYKWAWRIPIESSVFYLGDQIGAYWFLQVLFVVEVLNAFVLNYDRRGGYLVFIVIMSLIGYLLSIYHIHLPYRLEVCGLATLFYGIGFLLRDYLKRLEVHDVYVLLLLVISFVVSLFIPRLDMNFNQYGSYIPNIAAAILGTISIMLCCKKLDRWNKKNPIRYFFIWAGRNSIVVMGLSQVINMSMKYLFEPFEMPQIADFCLRQLFLWCILCFLSVNLNKYTPYLIGKKR